MPFVTASIGYDRPFVIAGQDVGAGAIIVNDKSGSIGLNVTKAYLSAAWHRKVKQHTIHVGFQGGYVSRTFDMSKLSFPDQFDWNSGGYNSDLPTLANLGNQSNYVDLNAGVVWSGKFRKFSPELGVALFHLNRPYDTFLNADNRVELRQVWHLGGTVPLSERTYLRPKVLYMRSNKATDQVLGSNIGYKLKTNKNYLKALYTGLLWRNGINRNSDALIFIGGMNFRYLDVGVSYDVNMSGLRSATNRRGGWELSLIFTPNTVVDKIHLPCERN